MKLAPLLPLVPLLLIATHREPRTGAEDFEHAFERVAEKIRPGVVSITSTRRLRLRGIQGPGDLGGLGIDPRLWPFLPEGEDDDGRSLREYGMGSGVVVSEDGYILTNHHVVQGASNLEVRLADGRTLPATMVGTDPRSDLAVVRVAAKGLASVQFGSSDDLKVGQWVAAFGSPFALEETMSCGIVSAKGRANLHIADFEDFLQTDAAINPGNSGGPLVDLRGEVVGINTAIVTRTGGYQGIGLAIPSGMAREIMESLIHEGKIVRGYLGVTIQEVTPELASHFGFGDRKGILVADVVADSPAAEAKLEAGDIVLSIDSQPVENVIQFRNRIADAKPDSKLTLGVWRSGKEIDVPVRIGTSPETPEMAAVEAGAPERFGLRLADLSTPLRRQLDLGPDVQGAVITEVEEDSVAEDAGLRAGDVILAIDRVPVRDAAHARQLLSGHTGEGVLLRVLHEGVALWVPLDLQGGTH